MNDISDFRKKIKSNEDIYEIKLEDIKLEKVEVKQLILKVNSHVLVKFDYY